MKDDGGPAFPQDVDWVENESIRRKRHFGISMRDYFAAAGLAQAYSIAYEGRNGRQDFDDIAKAAYLLADAMLAERAK